MKRLIIFSGILVFLFTAVSPVEARDVIRVYYAGDPQVIKPALSLDTLDEIVFVEAIDQADVFLLNGVIPHPSAIAERVREGAGLVLFLGPQISAQDVEELLGYPVELEARTDAVSLTGIRGIEDPLLGEIVWNGAPQVHAWMDCTVAVSSVQPLVFTYEDGSWMLWQTAGGRGFILNAFIQPEVNPQFQDWAYFNYLVYHMLVRAAGRTPAGFADYPGAPVPHQSERMLLLLVMEAILLTSFTAFFFVRRYSLAHPEALQEIVSDRRAYEVREAETRWEKVGFHRPLSGFMVAITLGLILFIPLIIYQNLVLPVYILPSAQALGIWGRVTQFFNLAWLFFDLGTSVAFIKFLSEKRVHDPARGIQYGQFFIWWQALSGAVQVALVVGLASTLAPRSAYALYSWSIIIHAIIQIPGFYQVMRHALNGFQRQDYARWLDIGLNVLLPILVQPLIVGIFFVWGKNHPVFGGAMGGLLGLGVAAYVAELLTFLIGFWLYRRLGYNARILFLAHFDGEVVKTSLRFGVFEMLGSVAWSAGQAAEIWITQARLINYTEIWGNWGLAQNFIFSFNVIQTLNDGVMPAISEAISHGKKLLSQYYSAQLYKWGGMISAFLGAVLLAVADRFILGASGPKFVRAARYVIPLAIWGAVQFPSWVGDNVQLGANRPYLKFSLVFGEQVVRVVLAYLLLDLLQINALILAYFIGLFSKGVVAYLINHRFCFPQRIFWWQSLVAPLMSGGVHYLLLRWLTGYLWRGDQVTSVLIFFLGILPSFPLYLFLYGLFGGWDDDTLQELRDTLPMTGFLSPLVKIIWASTALGARLSPLHGRFPIWIRAQALLEAAALTDEKVEL